MTYLIVVNDNGEFKTITQEELEAVEDNHPDLTTESWINIVLDERSVKNDTKSFTEEESKP